MPLFLQTNMRIGRFITFLVMALLIGAAGVIYYFYTTPALRSGPRTIYVQSGWNYDSLVNKLERSGLRYPEIFLPLSERMNLPAHIYAGKYKITGAETMTELIRKFRSADQEEVVILLKGEMSEQQVLHVLFTELELDSTMIYNAYTSSGATAELGLTDLTRMCLFIPDSYFFLWSVPAEDVIDRFAKEYKQFWDHEKKVRAMDIGLDPIEVGILASIVDAEVIYPEELARVAGVYLNRLRKNWPLQADPTIRYMIREEGRKRILNKDLRKDHPYNTYKHRGLPPGPLAIPSKAAIHAVLHAEEHNFMFFVAKDDFSGYHDFSVTPGEHEAKARRYRRALDRAGIMK